MNRAIRLCLQGNIMASTLNKPRPTAQIENNGLSPSSHEPDFNKTIQESKDAIQNAELKDVKKGPGRPRKSVQGVAQTPTSGPSGIPMAQPPPDVSVYLVVPIQAISKIPAAKHNIPELAFTEEEALACAKALDQCVRAFIPDLNTMSPKTAAILSLSLTLGTIGFTKYSIYSAEIAKRQPKPEIIPEPTEKPKEKPANISVGEYFNSINN